MKILAVLMLNFKFILLKNIFLFKKITMRIKNYYLLLLTLISFTVSAQLYVGEGDLERKINFDKGDYTTVKTKTTVFVIDAFTVSEFDLMLKDVWKITPYIVVTGEDFNKNNSKYITEQNAIFKLTSTNTSGYSGFGYQTSHNYYLYYYYYPSDIKIKKGKLSYKDKGIAGIMLHGNGIKTYEMAKSGDFSDADELFYAYQLGYLKNNLRFINDAIESDKHIDGIENETNDGSLKELAQGTLYVPQCFKNDATILREYAAQDIREKTTEALKDYGYKYEFITDEVLEQKLLEGNEKFYYLNYTIIEPYRTMSIINSKTGESIYRYTKLQPYAFDRFLNDISKKIKRAK